MPKRNSSGQFTRVKYASVPQGKTMAEQLVEAFDFVKECFDALEERVEALEIAEKARTTVSKEELEKMQRAKTLSKLIASLQACYEPWL